MAVDDPLEYWCIETANILRRGIHRAANLPATHRRRLVVSVLRTRLANVDSSFFGVYLDGLTRTLQSLPLRQSLQIAKNEEQNPKNCNEQTPQTKIPTHLLNRLLGAGASLENSQGLELLEQNVEVWIKALSRFASDANSLHEAIMTVTQRMTESDAAMKSAAQESFGRLLQALGPETLKKNLEKKTAKVGPFLKAAWFDAFEEKHAQLTAYHTKGFLTRDFRDMYRRHLKTTKE
ncbi:MAG: hypothetical protein OEW08_00105 [Gammaproteobacteria bacterium]|nr:hypothetical protein [Gammaproteobacteria bacterium]